MPQFRAIYVAKEESSSATESLEHGAMFPKDTPVSFQNILVVKFEINDAVVQWMKNEIRDRHMVTEHDQPLEVLEVSLRQKMPIIRRNSKRYELLNAEVLAMRNEAEGSDLLFNLAELAELLAG